MTEISFHFNVPDKLTYGCRLLRKAYLTGAHVVVIAELPALNQLDDLLWNFSPTEFVPHCRTSDSEATLKATPVLLTDSLKTCSENAVLINLGYNVPVEFERFERLIEVVSQADADRFAARNRWKHYADRGYALNRYDLATAAE